MFLMEKINGEWEMGKLFHNFVYYTLEKFSEYDNFRSNQIREGMISRESS